MPIVRIKVIAVSDQGDNVIVWGRTEHVPDDCEPVGYAFQTKGEHADWFTLEIVETLDLGGEDESYGKQVNVKEADDASLHA